jgi:acetyl esterase/lipase
MPIRFLLQASFIIVDLVLAGCTRIALVVANAGVDASAITTVQFDREHALSLDVHRPRMAVGAATCKDARAAVAPAHPAPATLAHPCAAPVVVFFYGGSWRNGTRLDYRFVGKSLARAGFLVIVPDYRKAPQVVFPPFIADSARAVAWARLHAAENGGDPSRMFLVGHSSGAHMAALLATYGRFLRAVGMQPRDIKGIVGLAGPYDFLPLTDPALKQVFGTQSEWPKSQPVKFVDGDEPPFLLFQGTADTLVRPGNAPSLAARLRAANEQVELRMLDGTSHSGVLVDLLRDASPVRQGVLRFLDQEAPATTGGSLRSPPTR